MKSRSQEDSHLRKETLRAHENEILQKNPEIWARVIVVQLD